MSTDTPPMPSATTPQASSISRRQARLAREAISPHRRTGRIFFALTVLILLVLLVDMWMGEAGVADVVTPKVIANVLLRHLPFVGSHFAPPSGIRYADAIVWDQRLPRALGAAMIGAMLALAGVAFQSLLNNPLADPYTVGVSSGSALGAMVVTLLGGTGLLAGFAQPIAAFATGLGAVTVVYMLARVGGQVSARTFLLSGIIVGTFFWSLIPLMVSLGNRAGIDRRSAILSELLGSLNDLGWSKVGLLFVFGTIGAVILLRGAEELDIMALGEESAAYLGVDTEAFKRRVILAGSLLTAAAVSVAGIIAFVGFVVPHMARRLVGANHRVLLPAAMLLGGTVLVASEWLSRVYLHSIEIGVVTSILGVPIFCVMLRRNLMQG